MQTHKHRFADRREQCTAVLPENASTKQVPDVVLRGVESLGDKLLQGKCGGLIDFAVCHNASALQVQNPDVQHTAICIKPTQNA